MAELLSCPCCGYAAEVVYEEKSGLHMRSNIYYPSKPGYVRCTHCGLRTKQYSRVSNAVEHWNQRV